ncbi:hypothetical protein [Natrialba sp. INN-245]|uniref:hypothetical protein n=1 Tax=Natrialba sp. INN-245 TaxID=2690967 RepID=UPI001313C2F4|nr:hypothetical protein [Natrialba sp. INN-245]MWV40360.1 hypothetical protein [Natrialba sp. INN-245]
MDRSNAFRRELLSLGSGGLVTIAGCTSTTRDRDATDDGTETGDDESATDDPLDSLEGLSKSRLERCEEAYVADHYEAEDGTAGLVTLEVGKSS